jgi:hypothetical protein
MPLSQNRVSRKLSIAAERPEGATALYNNKIHRAGQPVFQNLAVNHPGAESISFQVRKARIDLFSIRCDAEKQIASLTAQ